MVNGTDRQNTTGPYEDRHPFHRPDNTPGGSYSNMGFTLSVAIPTYRREQVLVDTLSALLMQVPAPDEILVIDQTPMHMTTVKKQLQTWDAAGEIRWLRLPEPSITRAMNQGLLAARGEWVLFLDDDIVPAPGLIAAHASRFQDPEVLGVVGQVLQPGQAAGAPIPAQRGKGIWRDLNFPFHTDQPAEIANAMAGNLSVRRERAIRAGGFDENFKGVAYRFETEFARRLVGDGGKLVFEPRARIYHLQASRGGTRAYGNPLCSPSPAHSVGEYYLALREGRGWERWSFILWRLFRSVRTRFHFSHPWCILVKLVGELRGLAWALRLHLSGPTLLSPLPSAAPHPAPSAHE